MGVLGVIHTAYSIYSPAPLEPMVIASISRYRTKSPTTFTQSGNLSKLYTLSNITFRQP